MDVDLLVNPKIAGVADIETVDSPTLSFDDMPATTEAPAPPPAPKPPVTTAKKSETKPAPATPAPEPTEPVVSIRDRVRQRYGM